MKIKVLKLSAYIFAAILILLPVLGFINAFTASAVIFKSQTSSQPILYAVKVVESSFQDQVSVVLENNLKTSECLNVNSNTGFLQGGSHVNLNQPANCFNLSKNIVTVAVEANLNVVDAVTKNTKVFVLASNEFLFDQIVKPIAPVSEQAQSTSAFALGIILVLSSLFFNRRFLIKRNFTKFEQELNFYSLGVMRC